MNRIAIALATSVAIAGLAAPALAQEAKDTGPQPGEIVVTATRRAEALSKVPLSITALNTAALEKRGVKDIADIARLTPGLQFDPNGFGNQTNIAIRGVSSTVGAATTGVYIDDTPIQSRHIGFGAVNAFPALFDLDRVEVLRGPQGTLFGAGAEGGAIRFITPQPSLTQDSGYVRSEVATTRHGDTSYEAGAAVGAPIIQDVLGFRGGVSFRRDGGWVDRQDQGDANWHETFTLRGALKWAVGDTLTVNPSFYYQDLHINDTASFWVALSDPGAQRYYNGNALTNPSRDPFWLAAVKVDWNVGFAQLTSNTSLFHRNQHSTSDYTQYLRATYGSFHLLPSIFPQRGDQGYAAFRDEQKNWYEELRLASASDSRLAWNTGSFFSHLDENVPEEIYDRTLRQQILDYSGYDLCDPLACPNGRIFHNPENRVVDKQIALFGELTYKLANTWSATAGVRIAKVAFYGTTFQGGPFLGTPDTTISASSSEKPVTPKAVIAWQPTAGNLFYASASKGYRVGGVNTAVGAICGADLDALGLSSVPDRYTSDNLWSYELGGKNAFLDHRLRINSSLFWIDWRNIQQNVYLPSCGEQFTANLGHVVSRGGDVDIEFEPVGSVLLHLTAAYTDAKFTRDSRAGDNTTPIVSAGDRLPGAPWSFTLAAEKRFADWYVRADFQYTTAQTALLAGTDSRNALHDTTIPGLPLTKDLQLRGGFRWSGYDISLFALNVLDQHPILFESRDIANDATDQLYFGRGVRPRTYGLTATYRY